MAHHDSEMSAIARMMRALAALPDDEARERVAQYVFARRFKLWGDVRVPTREPDDTPDMFEQLAPRAEESITPPGLPIIPPTQSRRRRKANAEAPAP